MQLNVALSALLVLALHATASPLKLLQRNGNGHAPATDNPSTYLGAGADPSKANRNNSGFNPVGSEFVKKPTYATFSGLDSASVQVALEQEHIELDLMNRIVQDFTLEEFAAAGLSPEDVSLIQYMGNQELGHALVFKNILGPLANKPCTYQYPYRTVKEAIDFSQKLTRWGESGTLGFIPQLDNRAVANIVLQSITTESRQQMIFRQFEGLFPMPVFFIPATPQAYQWTLLSPWIKECPKENHPIRFTIFPALKVTNNPNQMTAGGPPGITHNVTALTAPGREITFEWDEPGKIQGPYKQKTMRQGKEPKYAAFISQLNVTYAELYDIKGNTAKARQPGGTVLPELTLDPTINGTSFVSIVDSKLHLTPENITLILNHTYAGPAIYASG